MQLFKFGIQGTRNKRWFVATSISETRSRFHATETGGFQFRKTPRSTSGTVKPANWFGGNYNHKTTRGHMDVRTIANSVQRKSYFALSDGVLTEIRSANTFRPVAWHATPLTLLTNPKGGRLWLGAKGRFGDGFQLVDSNQTLSKRPRHPPEDSSCADSAAAQSALAMSHHPIRAFIPRPFCGQDSAERKALPDESCRYPTLRRNPLGGLRKRVFA